MRRLIYWFILIVPVMLSLSCGQEAATLVPTQYNTGYVDTSSGTSLLQVQAIYPTETDINVPVDTNIVIVFTKDVNPATIGSISLQLSGVPVAFTSSVSGKIVTLDPNTDLAYSTNYDVTVNTGVLATDGEGLDESVLTRNRVNFPTIASGTDDTRPRVLVATRSPSGDNVALTGNIEVTFSRPINTSTVNAGSFSISPNIATGGPVPVSSTVFQLPVNMAYNTTYTVTLTTAIQSTTGASLDNSVPSELTWTFKTDKSGNNFATGNYAIPAASVSVSNITSTSARISWNTNGMAVTDFAWGTSTAYGAPVSDNAEVHNFDISTGTLSPATKYYFRIRSYDTTPAVVTTITGYFITAEGATNDLALSSGGTNRQYITSLMDRSSGGSLNGNTFVLWLQGTAVRAAYLTGSTKTWEASVDTNSRTNPRMFSDARGYAIVTMQSGTNVYAKVMYNNGGAIGFQGGAWGDNTTAGLDVGTGSNATAAVIWGSQGEMNIDAGSITRVITSGVADVLPAGNWFYDFDVNFTATNVKVNDTIYKGMVTSSVTNNGTTFKYAINQNWLNVNAGNSYVIDCTPDPDVSGTADAYNTSMLLDDSVNFILAAAPLPVKQYDFVYNLTTYDFARVNADAVYSAMLTLDTADFTTNGDLYAILRFTPDLLDLDILMMGKVSSTGANLLIDSAEDFFAAGVRKGDLVYNVTDNLYAVVAKTVVSGDTQVELNKHIFTSATDRNYMVFRVKDSSPGTLRERLTETGTNEGTGNATLYDSKANFRYTLLSSIYAGVYVGDIVRVRGGGNLFVNSITDDNNIVLSANIAAGARYSILQPKVLIAYQRTDNIYARIYRLRDGASYGTELTLDDPVSVCNNPRAVADGLGGAYVFYERDGDIYGVHVDGVGTATAPVLVSAAGTFYLIDVKCDSSGNAYVLYEDAGTVYLTKRTVTLADDWSVTRSVTGHDSVMTIDSAGYPIVVYSNSGWIYISRYQSASPGTAVYTNVYVQHVGTIAGTYVENADSYRSNMSVTTGQSTGAIVSWVDNRYYNPHGYTVIAQLVDAGGTPQWGSAGTDYDGNVIGFMQEFRTTSSDYTPAASCYNDGAGNWNPLFFWPDFRNGITEIYYDKNISY